MTRTTRWVAALGLAAGLTAAPCAAAEPADASGKSALDEVYVWGERMLFDTEESGAATKSATPLRDLPVSLELIGEQVIDTTQFNEFAPVLDSFSLASSTPGERGLQEEILLRGFTDTPFYRNGVSDSLGALPVHDLANVEAIEILKGPNSAIYGPGEPGGAVNFLTKQPQFEAAHSLQTGFGRFGRFRIQLDSTGPLAEGSGLAYRFIGASEQADSFRDFIASERRFVAPSLLWAPDDRLEVLGAVEFIRHKMPFDSGTVAINGRFPLPDGLFLGEPATGDTRIEAFTATLDADYRWQPAWTVSMNVNWQETWLDGLRVEPAEFDDIEPDEPSAILVRELVDESENSRVFAAQLELQGDLSTGPLRHRVLAGYEYDRIRDATRLDVSDSEEEPFEIDVFDIEYGAPLPARFPEEDVRENIHQHGVYVQDFITLGERWRLLAGTRWDRFDADGHERVEEIRFDQGSDDFSSRVGLVFHPWKPLTLFGSYSESIDPNEGLLPGGEPLQPTRGKSVEAGLRLRYPLMKFTLDASVFEIEQTHVTTEAPGQPGFEIQTARQVSEGLDVEASLRPFRLLQLGLAYAYTDAEIRDDPEIPEGTSPTNVPRHKLVFYGLLSAGLRNDDDLRAGFSYVYNSKRQASLDIEELGVKLDGYSVVNVFASYTLNSHVEFGVNVSNLFGEDYLAGSQADLLHIVPGAPTTVYGTLSLKF
ncbi:MAG: TonB-dependent receptor [Gammaproteobacteria bacterium]|nr:TonB-dependent receptor [Gammaproteobacteria bacterium]